MKKRILSLVLALSLVFADTVTVFAEPEVFEGNTPTLSSEYVEDAEGEEDPGADSESGQEITVDTSEGTPADELGANDFSEAGEEEGEQPESEELPEGEVVPEESLEGDKALEGEQTEEDENPGAGALEEGVEYATGYVAPENYRDPSVLKEQYHNLRGSSLESRYVNESLLNSIPLRNQNPYGTCWAFSSIGLAEFSLAAQSRTANVNANLGQDGLSELHLAYYTMNSVIDPLGLTEGDQSENVWGKGFLERGGNYYLATHTLMNWMGAANEATVPYSLAGSVDNLTKLDDSKAYDDVAYLESVEHVSLQNNPDIVKEYIKKYGAGGISFYAANSLAAITSDSLYNTSNNAYYCPYPTSANHAVMIVGWDDNFDKTKFPVTPETNGAWLVRNSWTTGKYSNRQEYSGYFWMSYCDKSLVDDCVFFSFTDTSDYDNNYQYDGSIGEPFSYENNKMANVFEVASEEDGTEELRAVGVETCGSNATVNIRIYTDLTNPDNPESGTLVSEETATFPFDGYHVVELSDRVEMTKGTIFSVVVDPKDGCQIAVESESNNGTAQFNTAIKPGQSFAYRSRWDDLYEGRYYSGNARIKAFTKNITDATIVPVEEIDIDDPGYIDGYIDINKEEDYSVKYTVYPTDATDKRLVWTSSDEGIVTVDKKGVITGVGMGTATITVTTRDRNVSTSFDVHVARTLQGLSIKCSEPEPFFAGKTYQLSVVPTPAGATFEGDVSWTSLDTSVATIDENGLMTVLSTGNAKILASVCNGSVEGTRTFSVSIDNPVVTATKSGNTVKVKFNAVTGATDFMLQRTSVIKTKISDTMYEYSYSQETLGYYYPEPGQTYFEVTDDISNIPSGTTSIEYQVYAEAYGASSSGKAEIYFTASYKINYNAGIGKNPSTNPTRYTQGFNVYFDNPIAPEGYSAIGWYESHLQGCTNNLPLYDMYGAPLYIDYTLTAKYKPNSYKIKYWPNGGTGTMAPTQAAYGSNYTLSANTFTKTGYVFAGWNTETDGNGTTYANKASVKNLTSKDGGTVNLYAMWKAPIQKLEFNPSTVYIHPDDEFITYLTPTITPDYATDTRLSWTNSNPQIVKMTETGYGDVTVEPLKNGTATITAKTLDGSNKTATCTVKVTTPVKKVTISSKAKMVKGGTLKLDVVFNDADPVQPSDTSLKWTSSNPAAATINETTGVLTGKAGGTTIVKAVSNDGNISSNECEVTVNEPVSTVSLTSTKATLLSGSTTSLCEEMELRATALPETASDRGIEFESGNVTYLNVVDRGNGTCVLKPTGILPDGKSTVTVNVTANAVDGSHKYAVCTVTINQRVESVKISGSENIPFNTTKTLVPVFNEGKSYQPQNKAVTWHTSDASVAAVSTAGVVTGKAGGTAKVWAVSNEGAIKSNECQITVVQPVKSITLSETKKTLGCGSTSSLCDEFVLQATALPATASIRDLEIYSADSNYLTVTDNGDGTAKVKSTGKLPAGKTSFVVNVIAKAVDGSKVTATCPVTIYQKVETIELNKSELALGCGKTMALTPTFNRKAEGAELPNQPNNKALEWKTDNDTVAVVNASGVVTAKAGGEANIWAVSKENGSIESNKCKVTVTEYVSSVAFTAGTVNLMAGTSAELCEETTVATIVNRPTATDKSVVFTCSNDLYLTVTDNGDGTATVKPTGNFPAGQVKTSVRLTATATDGSKKSAVCTVNINQRMESIRINAGPVDLTTGQSFAMRSVLNGGMVQPADRTLVWSSSDPLVATVNASNGTVTAKSRGTATIKATSKDGSIESNECTVNVFQPVTSVKFNKTALNLSTGSTDAFRQEGILIPTVLPDNSSLPVLNFTSSAPQYLEVEKDSAGNAVLKPTGNLPAKATSVAVKITATTTDGSNKSTVCTVTLKQAVETLTFKQLNADGKAQVMRGKTLGLTPVFNEGLPYQPADKGLIWTTADPEIAVNANGVITGKSETTVGHYATVNVKSKDLVGKDFNVDVEVFEAVTGVKFNKTALNLATGSTDAFRQEGILTPEIVPATARYQELKYTSSAPQYLDVRDNHDGTISLLPTGQLPAKAVQTAVKITATSTDGTNKSTVCTVTLKQAVETLTFKQLNADGKAQVMRGKTLGLTPVFNEGLPYQPADKGLLWSIADGGTGIAVVNPNGTLTGKAVGNTSVIVKSKDLIGKSFTFPVETFEAVTTLTLNKTTMTLSTGSDPGRRQQGKLIPIYGPANATYKDVEYTSSAPQYLTVEKDAEGNAILKPTGNLPTKAVQTTVKITAKTTDGSNKSSVCTVTLINLD